MTGSVNYQNTRQNQKASSAGQASDEPLTFGTPTKVTVTSTSGVLLAAASGDGRNVHITIPPSADTGIHINLVGIAATTSHQLLPPGYYIFPTEQEIRAIRGGAADVSVYVMAGAVA
ncbi:MAG: hypothetical protein QOG31_215 [Thermoplasmata archaeon]|jgi:hypothetical protein|nr:hypothetical protein [Thermoplasmata archaeon]